MGAGREHCNKPRNRHEQGDSICLPHATDPKSIPLHDTNQQGITHPAAYRENINSARELMIAANLLHA
jgi:hypothetical protein